MATRITSKDLQVLQTVTALEKELKLLKEQRDKILARVGEGEYRVGENLVKIINVIQDRVSWKTLATEQLPPAVIEKVRTDYTSTSSYLKVSIK